MPGFGPIGSAPISSLPMYRVTAADTPEGKERLRAYYEALGRFVDMFARVEVALTLTLWHYAKTPPEIAKIVHGGTKATDAGATFIKQLAAVMKAPAEIQADLEDVISQMAEIKSVRNLILHNGAASVAEGRAIVSDAYKAKGEPRKFPVSPTILDDMTADLRKIAAHLNEIHLGKRSEYSLLGSPRLDAWRYKRPSPKTEPSKTGQARRRKKHRLTRPLPP